jgi:hypothetical protein
MAVHLGATRGGLGMQPPTLDIACTRRFRGPSRLTSSPKLVWGGLPSRYPYQWQT